MHKSLLFARFPRIARPVVLVFLISLLFISYEDEVEADIVKLKTGVIYEGKIINRRGTTIELELRDGSKRMFLEHQIEALEERPCSWEIYEDRKAKLEGADAKAWVELAEFCAGNALWSEWRGCLETALEADPENKDARRFLNFEKTDEGWTKKDLSDGTWSAEDYLRNGYVWKKKWLSPDEARRAAGLKLFRGEWKTKKEIKDILKTEEAEAQRLLQTMTVDEMIAKGSNSLTPYDECLYYFQLALRKNPKNPAMYGHLLTLTLFRTGDVPKAIRILAVAKKAFGKIGAVIVNECQLELYRGNYQQVVRLANDAKRAMLRENLRYDFSIITHGIALYYLGQFEEAVSVLKSVELSENAGDLVGHTQISALCPALLILGRKEEADRFFEEFKKMSGPPQLEYDIRIAALTKAKPQVLEVLKQYLYKSETVEIRDIHREWLKRDPAFKKYWKDPDFLKIVSAEGADSEEWSAVGVDSEDIGGKDIRKAAKRKIRDIDTSGTIGKWGALTTGHYYLFTNAPRPNVVEIGNRLELFAGVLDNLFDTKAKKGKEPILRIFRSEEEYIKYMTGYYRVPEDGAYYIPASEEVVTWAPDIYQLETNMGDIFSACTEQRLYADFGWPQPVWLTFGLSSYFSTSRHDKETFTFETGAPHREYLQAFKKMHPAGEAASDLAFFFTQTRLGLERTGVEGQAGKADLWGFMYFLMKSPDENVKKILPDYFAALRNKKDQKEALKVIYANIDRQTLSEMMVKFINEQ